MKVHPEYKTPSLIIRYLAYAVDHFLISLLITIPMMLMMSLTFESSDPSAMMMIILPLTALSIFLFMAKDFLNGQSPGKRLFGLQVRTYPHAETLPTTKQLFLRNVFHFVWIVDALTALVSKDRQKLGDQLMKTNVYTVRPVPVATVVGLFITAIVTMFGGIIVSVMMMIKSSAPYQVATQALRTNQEVITATGEITGFGQFPLGSVEITNGYGKATFSLQVKGERATRPVEVYLSKLPGQEEWQVKKVTVK